VIKIAESKQFENIIICFIVLSGIYLSFENPLNNPQSTMETFLTYFDYGMTAAFLIEALIKILAFGLYFNGDQSYLRKFQNVLDFIIVLSSVISLAMTSQSFEILKVIRMIRLLRPLKLIARNESLSLSMKALIVSIPTIFTLLVITGLAMFSFGIIGVELFHGMSFFCNTDLVTGMTQKENEKLIHTHHDCLNYGGIWQLKDINFDNVGHSTT